MESHHNFTNDLPDYSYTFKVALIGSQASGKTSLRRRIVDKTFETGPLDRRANRLTTVYPDNNIYNIETILDIVDIDDNCKFMYRNFNNADTRAILLVVDLTSMDSYTFIKNFLNNELKQKYHESVVVMLVGTKLDVAKRQVYALEISNLEYLIEKVEREYLGYVEVSAKTNANIYDLNCELANALLQKYLPDEMKPTDYVSFFQEKEAKKILLGIKNDIMNPQKQLSFPFSSNTTKIFLENGTEKEVLASVKSHLDYIETAELNIVDRRRYYHALSFIEQSCKEENEKTHLFGGTETREYLKNNSSLTSGLTLTFFGKKPECVIEDKIQVKANEPVLEPLDAFLCPISGEQMVDPVIVTTSGNTYDRKNIEAWLDKNQKNGQAIDPLIPSILLEKKHIVPNRLAKDMIEEFNKKYMQNSSTISNKV